MGHAGRDRRSLYSAYPPTLPGVERVRLQHQSSDLSYHPILQLRLQSSCHPVPVVSYPSHLQDSRLRHLQFFIGECIWALMRGLARVGEGGANLPAANPPRHCRYPGFDLYIHQNRRKSIKFMKIYQNPRKSTKINKNQRKSMIIK